MKTYLHCTALALALLCPEFLRAAERQVLNLDPNWRFIKDDPQGASARKFDDSGWEVVSAPHTYNDVDTFDDWSLPGHRGEQNQWSGRTWYRKTFTLPAGSAGKKVFIEFEGVRQIGEVYLNGHLLGASKTGFTPFGFELTPFLSADALPNVLAVMCDNRFMKDPLEADYTKTAKGVPTSTPNPNLAQLSAKVNQVIPEDIDQLQADQIPWNNPHWHPAHGGIYRNVYLTITDPLHITLPLYSFLQTEGPYAYATDLSAEQAHVTIEIPVKNERSTDESISIQAEILAADGKTALSLSQKGAIAAGKSSSFKISGILNTPQLWEPDYPYLYHVLCSISIGGKVVDTYQIPFGLRTVRWDVDAGFFINGRHLKLHGWGQKPTQEWPGLGAAQPDWMHFYTLNLMKQAGGNIVRWGHSAGGPALINSGDKLGLIAEQPGVDGESDTVGAAWKLRASAFRDTIIYYRNNPSILIWEGGNQKVTRAHAQELRGYMDKYDPHGGRAYAHRRADQVTAEFMDLGIGTEGGREIARLPVVEGEYDREESPRRVWDNASPPNFGYPEGKGQTYQLTSEQFAVNEVGQYVRKLGAAYHSGGSNWIFSDSTSGGRVGSEVARAGGEVDGVRLAKEAYYVCKVMFQERESQVYIIGHWTYPEKTQKTVYVVSNDDDVELFINGKTRGHGKVSDHYLFTFPDVEWEKGEIKAVAFRSGKVIATQSKHTVGEPVKIKMTALTGPGGLRADGSDVALIDVEAVDANGERCPTFQQRVDFELEGPALWRGGYNSGKINSINHLFLDLEAGINRVALRSMLKPGKITLKAKSQGLEPASIRFSVTSFPLKDGYSSLLPTLPASKLTDERLSKPTTADLTHHPAVAARPILMAGRFTKTFSYTGPNIIVHMDSDATNGKNVYVDRDYPLANLPKEFIGADHVQTSDEDARYSAVDLMQLAVAAGATVYIAHDDRLSPPNWLTSQFKPTAIAFAVDKIPLKIYQRHIDRDKSLTLGSNTDESGAQAGLMYVLFVKGSKTP